jgi:hypothetical protein
MSHQGTVIRTIRDDLDRSVRLYYAPVVAVAREFRSALKRSRPKIEKMDQTEAQHTLTEVEKREKKISRKKKRLLQKLQDSASARKMV